MRVALALGLVTSLAAWAVPSAAWAGEPGDGDGGASPTSPDAPAAGDPAPPENSSITGTSDHGPGELAPSAPEPAAGDEKQVTLEEPEAGEPEEAESEAPKGELDFESERRADFLLGVMPGVGIGATIGYPNDALKIDRSEYRTDTGGSGGGNLTLWIGGALSDWVTFGFEFQGGILRGADHQTRWGSIGFRAEGFPGYSLSELGKEFGISADVGVALLTTTPNDGEEALVDSGGASRFGFGVFYEGIRAWQFSMGPYVGADVVWSPSALRPMAVIGWRTALYSGP